MTDDERLDHLIGALYEAVLDPGRWKEMIGLRGHYAGGVDAQLLTINKKTEIPISAILAETYFLEQGNAGYVRYYGTLDPRIRFLSQGSIGEWRCCHDVDKQIGKCCRKRLIPATFRGCILFLVDSSWVLFIASCLR